ncbi:MAG: hypothetical protein HY681_04270, partial [Chloroflexi bacterium]|nr:hypothetical protein [Chloroflexota bacterium]
MKISRSILAAAFLLLPFFPALGVRPAYACSCAGPDPERVVGFADVIVIGTVDGVEIPPRSDGKWSSIDPAYVSVTVERYLKGSGGVDLVFTTARSGASCGALEILDVGMRHVLLLRRDAGSYTTSLCSGNASLVGDFSRWPLRGASGETYLANIVAITGQGIEPEGQAEALRGPDAIPGFTMPWGLAVLGLAGVLA